MTKVLDHGYVNLERYMASDLIVVQNARQSFSEGWRAGENEGSDARLIRHLMRESHSVPFQHCIFSFSVVIPIFVERQWRKHRTWVFTQVSEHSARYRELPELFYLPTPETLGVQSKNNKQARNLDAVSPTWAASQIECMQEQCAAAFETYRDLLAMDVPRELARCVLPLNTYTYLSMTVDLWNLLHFLDLRTHEHAQYEIVQYANAIINLIAPVVPVTMAAWKECATSS